MKTPCRKPAESPSGGAESRGDETYMFGRTAYLPSGWNGPRRQRVHFFIAILEGSVVIDCNGRKIPLAPGQGVILPPGGLEFFRFDPMARTSTLLAAADASHFGKAVALKKPFGEDQSQLRNSLVPGLLASLRRNLDQGAKSIALFEFGRVFHPAGEGQRLGIVLTGERHALNWRGWSERPWDVFDLTGAVRQLACLRGHDIVPTPDPVAPFRACADLLIHAKEIGVVGRMTPAVARQIGASAPLLCAEFDLDLWRAAVSTKTQDAALAKFPGSARDIAFVSPLDLPCGKVRSLIESLKEPSL